MTDSVAIRKFIINLLAEESRPRFAATLQRAASASAMRVYALPPDSTITPAAAGRAFHYLIWWPDPRESDLLLPGPDSAGNAWSHAEGSDTLGTMPPATWCGDLISRAAHGLSEGEVAALGRLTAAQPRDTLFHIFARAREADILGTRWTYKASSNDPLFFYALPLPYPSSFRSAVRIWCGRAVLQLHDGHPEAAERTLKEALAGSILLMDEAPDIGEMVLGSALSKSVAGTLANLYDATNRGGEAASLSHAMQSARPVPLPGHMGAEDVTVWDVVDALPVLSARSDLPQALKWLWLASALTIKAEQYCVGDHDLGPEFDSWLAMVRRGAVRRPSDGRFLDWITQMPTHRGPDCMGPAQDRATDDSD